MHQFTYIKHKTDLVMHYVFHPWPFRLWCSWGEGYSLRDRHARLSVPIQSVC